MVELANLDARIGMQASQPTDYCVFRSLLDIAAELSWTAGTAGAGHSVRLSWSFPNRGREHLCSFVQSPSE